MFKNEQELKAFIEWAKASKLKKFKIENIEVEFSDFAYIEQADISNLREATDFEQKSLVDTEPVDPKEENDLLFWSSR